MVSFPMGKAMWLDGQCSYRLGQGLAQEKAMQYVILGIVGTQPWGTEIPSSQCAYTLPCGSLACCIVLGEIIGVLGEA